MKIQITFRSGQLQWFYLPGEEDWSQPCVETGVAPSSWRESGRTWGRRQSLIGRWLKKNKSAWSSRSLQPQWQRNKLRRLASNANTGKRTLHRALMNNEHFLLQLLLCLTWALSALMWSCFVSVPSWRGKRFSGSWPPQPINVNYDVD